MKKTLQRYRAWAASWSKSQLTFTTVLVVFSLGLALYATSKYAEAAEAASFWYEQALQ